MMDLRTMSAIVLVLLSSMMYSLIDNGDERRYQTSSCCSACCIDCKSAAQILCVPFLLEPKLVANSQCRGRFCYRRRHDLSALSAVVMSVPLSFFPCLYNVLRMAPLRLLHPYSLLPRGFLASMTVSFYR